MYKITEDVITWPHGSEYLVNKDVTLVETFEEDGIPWGVFSVDLGVVGVHLMRIPLRFIKEIKPVTTRSETSTVLSRRKTRASQSHKPKH